MFYDAFARGDVDGLRGCYHPDVSFGDPVFTELQGRERVVGMWRMLLGRASEFEVSARDIDAGDHSGSAHWTVRYTFPPTGRRVRNEVDAQFRFEDGLIVRHRDVFDFRRWSTMAFGVPSGMVIGSMGVLRRRVRDRARGQLEEYLRGNSPISG